MSGLLALMRRAAALRLSLVLPLYRFVYLRSPDPAGGELLRTSAEPAGGTGDERGYVELLRRRLRRAPYWSGGHLELARAALRLDRVALAYASSHALRVLGAARFERELLLARCHLRRADAPQAEMLLAPLYKDARARRRLGAVIIAEDLAAALMAQNKNHEARALLEGHRREDLTAPAQAALRYLQQQAADQREVSKT